VAAPGEARRRLEKRVRLPRSTSMPGPEGEEAKDGQGEEAKDGQEAR
jgi:hypothetical protein